MPLSRRAFVQTLGVGAAGVLTSSYIGARGREHNVWSILEPSLGAVQPGLSWPRQIEIRAGKHVVRPRYEVISERHRRIAHVNVERTDLRPDPELPRLPEMLGKGYLLPAPILPRDQWESVLLPTPMAVSQTGEKHGWKKNPR